MENHFCHIRWAPLSVTIFIIATPMTAYILGIIWLVMLLEEKSIHD